MKKAFASIVCCVAPFLVAQTITLDVENATQMVTLDMLSTEIPSLIGHPYILQGATEVKAENASVVGNNQEVSFTGGVLTIISQSTSPHYATNTVTISVPDGYYLYDIHGDVYKSTYVGSTPLEDPVELKENRIADNTIQLSASTPIGYGTPTDGKFYCIISNFWASTYDRAMYQPHSVTNDTLTMPTFVDDYTDNESREAVNARSLNRRIDELKNEIAAHTWARTPGGQRADEGVVHIDVPVLYSGQFSFLQAGSYACISADGGGFINSTDGSGVFNIGLSGRADFQISADERQLHVVAFTASNDAFAIDVSTNGMVNASVAPSIKYKLRLDNTGWLLCQEMQASYIADTVNGDYWRCLVSARGDSCFYSAWASQGVNKVTVNQPLHVTTGEIVINGETYTPTTVTIGGTQYKILATEAQ